MDARNKADLQRLTAKRQGVKALADPSTPAPVLKATSLGRPASSGSAMGIASPLTESDASTRAYHADASITTTDGVLTWVVQPLKQVDMVDANGQGVQLIFDNPYA